MALSLLQARKLVVERDDDLCVLCYRSAVAVHHIVPRSMFGKKTRHLRDHPKNLCCLCDGCHTDFIESYEQVVMLLRLMTERYGYEYPESKFRQWREGTC